MEDLTNYLLKNAFPLFFKFMSRGGQKKQKVPFLTSLVRNSLDQTRTRHLPEKKWVLFITVTSTNLGEYVH